MKIHRCEKYTVDVCSPGVWNMMKFVIEILKLPSNKLR